MATSTCHLTIQFERVFHVAGATGNILPEGEDAWPEGYGALIVIRDLEGSILGQTQTGPSGHFSFPEVARGRYCLQISQDGWQSVIMQVQISKEAQETLVFELPLDS